MNLFIDNKSGAPIYDQIYTQIKNEILNGNLQPDEALPSIRALAKDLKISEVAVAGGVSANSGLRDAFVEHGKRFGWKVHIPKFSFTTDNAAMVAITGYYKFQDKVFCPMEAAPFARMEAKLG